jgi:hypothetical protein
VRKVERGRKQVCTFNFKNDGACAPYRPEAYKGNMMSDRALPKCITVVLHMPDNIEDRKRVTEALGVGEKFHGALVTGMSLEDEISVVEFVEDWCDAVIMTAARKHAAALHENIGA